MGNRNGPLTACALQLKQGSTSRRRSMRVCEGTRRDRLALFVIHRINAEEVESSGNLAGAALVPTLTHTRTDVFICQDVEIFTPTPINSQQET
jgi:hypothetical protein